MTLGARALMLDGDKVFLIRHTYVPGWHFPGGGVEPGETARQALDREVWEETGYRVSGEPDLFGLYFNRRASRRDDVALFVCKDPRKEREFRPGREIAEAGWFDRHDLPEALGEGTRLRIEEYYGERPKGHEW